jgi:hypothetical protein
MIIPTLLRLSEFILRLASCLVDFTKSRAQYRRRLAFYRSWPVFITYLSTPILTASDRISRCCYGLRLVSGQSWLSGIGVLPLSNLWRLQAGRASFELLIHLDKPCCHAYSPATFAFVMASKSVRLLADVLRLQERHDSAARDVAENKEFYANWQKRNQESGIRGC